MKKYTLLVLLYGLLHTYLCGQNNAIITIYSENQNYSLTTKPYSVQPYDTIGLTEIYRLADSSLIYRLDKFLNSNFIFLSNDGNSIMVLTSDDNIHFYRNGKIEKHFEINELQDFENNANCEHNLFFTFSITRERSKNQKDFEKEYYANKSPIYTLADTLYLLICTDTIIMFDIKKGVYIKSISIYDSSIDLSMISYERKIEKEKFNPPNWSRFPKLIDGSNLEIGLAGFLNMTFDDPKKGNLKYYNLSLRCLINSNGKCEEIYPEFELKYKEDSIKLFLGSVQFDTTIFPEYIEKWVFHDYYMPFRKNETEIANIEFQYDYNLREKIRKQNLVADSIKGIYIPKNIEECISQLDELLSDKRKAEFLKSGTVIEYFGLGLWIRNNWGLWSDSRLRTYFITYGFNHPDDMSGFILEMYFKHLKDNTTDAQQEFEKYLKDKSGTNAVPVIVGLVNFNVYIQFLANCS